jgi:hypothetical protein
MPDPYPDHPVEPDENLAGVVALVAAATPLHCQSCEIGRAEFVAYWDNDPADPRSPFPPAAFAVGSHCARRARDAGAELWPIDSDEGRALLSLYHWKRWAA